jgi:transcriptional regulator GlxA family with amidase domain
VRLDRARALLEQTDWRIAAKCGFGSSDMMQRAFARNLRLAPRDYRSRAATPGE